ncbi:MAG: hypothetical protein Kow0037_27600 [Calditrichia bacterium]
MFTKKWFILMSLILVSGLLAAGGQVEKRIMIKRGPGAMLGIVVKNADPELLKKNDLEAGVEVKKVLEGTEAERIGLKAGDILTGFAGQSIKSVGQLNELAEDLEPGDKVEITVVRDGKKLSFTAKMQKPKEMKAMFLDENDLDIPAVPHPIRKKIRMELKAQKGGFLGVTAKNLNEQLKKYFEVENGVLIESVVKDSPAEKAGLLAGDVITAIGEKKVNDYEDLVRYLNYYDPGDKVKVYFSRKGKKKSLTVELGEKQHSGFFGSEHGLKWFSDDDDVEIEVLPELEKHLEIFNEWHEKGEEGDVEIEICII